MQRHRDRFFSHNTDRLKLKMPLLPKRVLYRLIKNEYGSDFLSAYTILFDVKRPEKIKQFFYSRHGPKRTDSHRAKQVSPCNPFSFRLFRRTRSGGQRQRFLFCGKHHQGGGKNKVCKKRKHDHQAGEQPKNPCVN